MASSSSQYREERAEPSHLRKHDGFSKKDIFLSHSGQQKDFVEYLYHALERANQKAFMDNQSLPKASRFAGDIRRAVEDCKLGIVVLSDDFINSKWPMLELAMLFEKRKKILPLFYKLDTPDLKCKEKLSQWKQRWEEMVNEGEVSADKVKEWEGLLQKLRGINGIVFKQQGSIHAYIEMVVTEICKLAPCQVRYDLSSIYGHEELAKGIGAHFDAGSCEEARVVGLYGVGGQGKTTLCMTMLNFYISQYNGRCCLIEFPTDGSKAEVLQVCKEALITLANPSGHVLERIHSFQQVIQQMKDRVREHDVFIAIDNIWSNSEEEAGALLSVDFTAASKILLTSRSETVLRNLLDGHSNKNSHVGSLPTPEQGVAFQIFENSLKLGNDILPVRYQLYGLLKKCRFDGDYHPLALKAMGQYVRKSLDGSVHHLGRVLEEINNINLKSVHEAVKLNYECLSQVMQYIFLDIALWVECQRYYPFKTDSWEGSSSGRAESTNPITRWLCHLYNESSEMEITRSIHELAEAGVIQREVDEVGQQMIRVHDLYLQLAEREAAISPRFLKSTKAVEGLKWIKLERMKWKKLELERVKWKKLERVMTSNIGESSQFLENLQKHECPKVKFLYAEDLEVRRRIHMKSLPSLRILMLRHLESQFPSSASSRIDVSGCPQLEFVLLEWCPFVERLDGLYALSNLQILVIQNCPDLKNFDCLGCLTKLEILVAQRCHSLMNLPDLGGALKELKVRACGALKKLPDLGGAAGLERLELWANDSLEEVVGCLNAALKKLTVRKCGALKTLPDLGSATGLERLELWGNGSLEEVVGCLSGALKELKVRECGALKKLPDLGGAMGLESLELWENDSLEEVVGCLSGCLKYLQVGKCGVLKKLPDLGGAMGLERLALWENDSLEEVVGCLSGCLESLEVGKCGVLKKLPDLSGATGLERLELWENDSLEEVVGCLSGCLKNLEVGKCGVLKKLPDLSGATGLERLELWENGSLEEVVGCLSGALQKLKVGKCGALKKLPNLGGATGLQWLELRENESLEEVVGCMSGALKGLRIEGCRALRKLPDLAGATGLERLKLRSNGSFEDVEKVI